MKDSLHCLLMETKSEVGRKYTRKLSFCPFCQYLGSNDQSYMKLIICSHYNANYGCGKCLDEVFITVQLLCRHMQTCKGLHKEAADQVMAEDMGSAPSSSEKKKMKRSKSRDAV